MEPTIHPADRGLRRTTAVVLVVAAIGAIAVLALVREWMFARAVASTPEQFVVQMRQWIGLVAAGSGACLAVLAAYAVFKARRAAFERRWPLERSRVLVDTPVRRGDAVVPVVRMLRLVAAITFAFAIGMFAVAWRLLAQSPG